jgi:hypothetical protein
MTITKMKRTGMQARAARMPKVNEKVVMKVSI